jgi:hypothetical protein
MFDVGGLWRRFVSRPGFAGAWARATGAGAVAVGLALVLSDVLSWGLVPTLGLALGAAFLGSVPGAFTLGSFARSALGLLACVPEAEDRAEAHT